MRTLWIMAACASSLLVKSAAQKWFRTGCTIACAIQSQADRAGMQGEGTVMIRSMGHYAEVINHEKAQRKSCHHNGSHSV